MSDNLHHEPPPPPPDPGNGQAKPPKKKRKRSGSETRRRERVISVRVYDKEGAIIDANADAVQLKPSGFLRFLGTGFQRPHERRPRLPELLPYKQGYTKINIAAKSICEQFLRAMNCGELVDIPELRSAAAKLDACAAEMMAIIRDYSGER
jgi:hypothetical protein